LIAPVKDRVFAMLVLFCSLVITASAWADSYLPLAVGNRWEYASGDTVDVLITEDGGRYFTFPVLGGVFDFDTAELVIRFDFSTVTQRSTVFRLRPGSEFSIEVEADEVIDGQRYFRLSTGNRFRYNDAGQLVEYTGAIEERVAIDIPAVLEGTDPEAPWGWSSFFGRFIHNGAPSSAVSTLSLETALGTVDDTVVLGMSEGGGRCQMTLAADVGIVHACCGFAAGSDCTVIVGAVLDGEAVDLTAVPINSWGTLKNISR
jgi:hypothetical protein